ncbi:MAG: PTS sugar transporter subunit IIA [Kiritimatiellae bacterium]|nr:PTS sugar transporter subunit IIA [Kiritimatiellia bacterium]
MPGTDAPGLFARMVELLAAGHPEIGDPAKAVAAVLEREKAAPSFLAPGVAMPHARLEGIERTYVAVATPEKGAFGFGGPDGPARVAVLVLTPRETPAAYLKVAAAIARRLDAPGAAEKVASLSTAAEVAAFFVCGGADLREPATAGDLMAPVTERLHETDSVKDAIDLIVRTGLSEIPVVDKEGDLVGVASARALLRTCLPDYLLWMENLSRFSDFQPFETLMHKESSTWLADITDDGYAAVQADDPAIAVAEAMARLDADRCYVLRGARLVGMVTLPRFLHNVFRD